MVQCVYTEKSTINVFMQTVSRFIKSH